MQAENTISNPPLSEEKTLHQEMGILILAGSLLMGLVGNFLFFEQLPGLNILLFLLLFLTGGILLLSYFKRPIYAKNMSLMLPAVFFAAMLVVFAAPQLVTFNLLVMVSTLFLMLRYTSNPHFLGGNWLSPIFAAIESAIIGWFEGPLRVLSDSTNWLSRRLQMDNQHSATFGAVLRGLLLTIPILIVFGLLLGSADILFGDLLEDSLGWLKLDTETLVARCLLIGILAWLSMAGYKLLLFGSLVNVASAVEQKTIPLPRPFGMIEASMVLGSVDALFLFFVTIQARYLFGGEANITAQGYTYSEYARRGFWEILAVSILTMGLVIVMDTLTRRSSQQETLFRALSFALIILTLVLLAAAFQRLILYEDAYGFTRLRVMTQIFILWLCLLFGVLMIALLRQQFAIFAVGCLLIGIGFIATLNLMNMDAFIASRNIVRFQDTGKLDADYLTELSTDAVPIVAPLLDHPDRVGADWEMDLLSGLGQQLYWLDRDREERGWIGYHYSKDRAWEVLDPYRELLEPYMRPDRWGI